MFRTKPLLPIMLAIAALSGGCSFEELLGQSELTLLWAVAPFLGFALVGGLLVHMRRRGQIRHWDLAHSPAEPTAQRILWSMVVIWILLSIGFAVLNLRLPIDPGQALMNIGLWVVGSILGGLLGLMVGLNTAEPRRYTPPKQGGA